MRSSFVASALSLFVGVGLGVVDFAGTAAAADEGDPNHGNFTLAEATKGLPGPAAGALEATIETNKGKVVCELFDKQAPVTVANFIGLATGKRAWMDPKTNKWVKAKPFYNGLVFHRVIPGFMIQGGDPMGTGMGNPGYKFQDEFVPELKFDKPGQLAMANAGPATNGSQFFITDGTPGYLSGRHTIFGQCEPVAVVSEIAHVKRGANDRPEEEVVMKKVTIQHAKPAKGAAAAAAKAKAEKPAAAAPAAEKKPVAAPAPAAEKKPAAAPAAAGGGW